MLYFPNLNIVYCPIERTASRSIQKYFFDHDSKGYLLNKVYRHTCKASFLDGLAPEKIYISTRHPWDRFCSMFSSAIITPVDGYGTLWNNIDEYLDHYLKFNNHPFLEEEGIYQNIVAPHQKYVGNDALAHFYRSQTYYFEALSSFNLIEIKYESLNSITQESWANSEITLDHIGQTDNQANELWTKEREEKLRFMWDADYQDYSNWRIS